MSAKYALVILGTPEVNTTTGNPAARRQQFLATARGSDPALQDEGADLGEGCWLLPLHESLHTLGELVRIAREWGVPLRTLFLDEKPDFVLS